MDVMIIQRHASIKSCRQTSVSVLRSKTDRSAYVRVQIVRSSPGYPYSQRESIPSSAAKKHCDQPLPTPPRQRDAVLAQFAIHAPRTDAFPVTIREELGAFDRGLGRTVQIDENTISSPLRALLVASLDPGQLPCL